jgi:hypothetical protein
MATERIISELRPKRRRRKTTPKRVTPRERRELDRMVERYREQRADLFR